MTKLRILSSAYDYRPALGGVASCTYEVLNALNKNGKTEIKLLARSLPGDTAFDAHVPYETTRFSIPEQSLVAAVLMSRFIAQKTLNWKPHAILNFLWLPGGTASFLASPARLITKTPYFVFAHGVEVMESDRSFKKRLRGRLQFFKRRVFENAEVVFAVSHFTRNLLLETCELPPEKIKIINNGVNPDEFQPHSQPADLVEKYKLHGKKILLTISRLEAYKGLDRAIAALRFVVKQIPNVRYLICGEGPDRHRLEQLARHYRVTENVIFAGAIPFERRKDYYNLCDCFVLLTRTDLLKPEVEGFGLVFLEAAACGKPSIGGNSGGIPDAIDDQKSGWLVDPQDDREIAENFIRVLTNEKKTHEMGIAARNRALSSMTWDHAAEKVYQEILKHVRN